MRPSLAEVRSSVTSVPEARVVWMAGIVALALFLEPNVAQAYVGPGAGVTAIGAVLSLIGAAFLALVGFVWYPIRRLLRARKKASGSPGAANGAAPSGEGSVNTPAQG